MNDDLKNGNDLGIGKYVKVSTNKCIYYIRIENMKSVSCVQNLMELADITILKETGEIIKDRGFIERESNEEFFDKNLDLV